MEASHKLFVLDTLRRVHRKYLGLFHSTMRFPTYSEWTRNELRYTADPIRYSAIGLAIARLKREGVEGDFAELGVWRGDTSRFLHLSAPDRVLHLFDTFSGFPAGVTQDKPYRFRNTSLELVKERLGDLRNVEFHVGFFPDTTAGLEERRFAFVMLDADCYESTLSGLKFFYPRTSSGGYIFLHDFNSPESDYGVSRAACEFLAHKPEKIVEISDTWGSALFRRMG